MAIQQQQVLHEQETLSEQNPSCLLDSLFCEEQSWEEEEEAEEEEEVVSQNNTITSPLSPLLLLEKDLFLEEDEELLSLFSKEHEQQRPQNDAVVVKNVQTDPYLSFARQEAAEWMLMVKTHYGFSTLTPILAMNYLDRFLSSSGTSDCFQKGNTNKPWMIQLVAVTCLSLAAKVEEIQVPLLLDLQVEGTKYVFEAKTIQRMELLVLSTLKWKMHPVTPLSFLDHIIRRLGLKTHLHWEFLRRCEHLLLSVVSDSRFVGYMPSVLATATMMHVIDQVEAFNPIEYQDQLLGVLKISKEKVKGCYEVMGEISKGEGNAYKKNKKKTQKRKYELMAMRSNDMINSSANDSNWDLKNSPQSPLFKKTPNSDQWVFVDVVANP